MSNSQDAFDELRKIVVAEIQRLNSIGKGESLKARQLKHGLELYDQLSKCFDETGKFVPAKPGDVDKAVRLYFVWTVGLKREDDDE